ncbi:MAG: hypothetical protein ACTSP3_04165 [Candidatus Heimdallarchaeaceae archaeon]
MSIKPTDEFDLNSLENLEETVEKQVSDFTSLKEMIQNLTFVPVEPIGGYGTIAYKAYDGGKMGIYFDPFQIDFVRISDNFGREIMKFITPKGVKLDADSFAFLNNNKQIQNFTKILGLNSITEVSSILKNPQVAMELAEFACMFDRLVNDLDPVLIMRDGLLRTKSIKLNYVHDLLEIVKKNKPKKIVGVAKSTKVLDMISTMLYLEKKIPNDQTGYIEISNEIELKAYRWTGKGKINEKKQDEYLHWAFGKLFVAKLSKQSNLLVTLEIPYDYVNNQEIYNQDEISQIIGHLIKDSEASYPILGYPQTIMKAHYESS